MPGGFISLNRTVVIVTVHTFLLQVTLTLQPCISDSLLFITGVIGLPLNNENNTDYLVISTDVFAVIDECRKVHH